MLLTRSPWPQPIRGEHVTSCPPITAHLGRDLEVRDGSVVDGEAALLLVELQQPVHAAVLLELVRLRQHKHHPQLVNLDTGLGLSLYKLQIFLFGKQLFFLCLSLVMHGKGGAHCGNLASQTNLWSGLVKVGHPAVPRQYQGSTWHFFMKSVLSPRSRTMSRGILVENSLPGTWPIGEEDCGHVTG